MNTSRFKYARYLHVLLALGLILFLTIVCTELWSISFAPAENVNDKAGVMGDSDMVAAAVFAVEKQPFGRIPQDELLERSATEHVASLQKQMSSYTEKKSEDSSSSSKTDAMILEQTIRIEKDLDQIKSKLSSFMKQQQQQQSGASSSTSTGTASSHAFSTQVPPSGSESERLIWRYLGCYKDDRKYRDLEHFAPLFAATVETCAAYCSRSGYRYFGLQNRLECWCGSSYGRYGSSVENGNGQQSSHPEAKNGCSFSCNLSPEFTCGGEWLNDIYEIVQSKPKKEEPAPDIQDMHSSVWCYGEEEDKICNFRNLCWENPRSTLNSIENHEPWSKSFVFHWDYRSVVEAKEAKMLDFPENRAYPPMLSSNEKRIWPFMDLNTVNSIFVMGLTVRNADALAKRKKKIHFVKGTSLIFSRFLPYNIMHTLHDDMLGAFFTLIKYAPPPPSSSSLTSFSASSSSSSTAERRFGSLPYDLNTQLVIADDHAPAEYLHMLRALSDKMPVHVSDLAPPDSLLDDPFASEAPMVCFERAITGLEHTANWYQYGFKSPQGPIPGKEVSGRQIRWFSGFVYQRLSQIHAIQKRALEEPVSPAIAASLGGFHALLNHRTPYRAPVYVGMNLTAEGNNLDIPKIVIFSRTQNRLILNENELSVRLYNEYALPVLIVRLEEMNFVDILRALMSTRVALGMHGSVLILAMFLPKDSLLLEMYPFAVPAKNYTPYKTLARMKGMDIKYVAWENTKEENNVAHPDNPRLLGGLTELSAEERQKVMETRTVPLHVCCENPFWLYRIYQDTRVDVDAILRIITQQMGSNL